MPEAIMKVLHGGADEAYLKDLEAEIMDAVGDLSGIGIWGQEILMATFHQPAIRKSGLIVGHATQSVDDKWQSKSLLVLKLGDKAGAAATKAGRPIPEVGKWYYGLPVEHEHYSIKGQGGKNRPSVNGQPYRDFEGWPCRMVLIGDIRGPTLRPWEIM